MKNLSIFLASIFSFLLFVFLACDKSEINDQEKEVSNKEEKTGSIPDIEVITLDFRVDCEDCDECCCGLQLLSTGSANIRLCGTTDGTGSCGTFNPPNCPSITGGGKTFSLDFLTDPKHLFCMDENTALAIRNDNGSSIDVSLTCQEDNISNPKTVFLPFQVIQQSITKRMVRALLVNVNDKKDLPEFFHSGRFFYLLFPR